jgi:very-short-patch-repair endonuclease
VKVVCLICGKSFARIGNHIKKHGITMDEYHARFPGAETCAYRHAPETIAKMRGPRPSFQGRPKSDAHKENLSKSRRGRKFQPHSPETIAKMQQAWERRKANEETYAAYVQGVSERMSSPEAQKRMRDRTAALIQQGNHNGKSKDTGIELDLKEYLDGAGLAYEHQFVVDTRKGAFTFDFFITSLHLLVEVDGEYWHAKSLEVWNRDKLKQRLASELGFTVARISDQDWHPEIIHESQDTIKASSDAILERRRQRIMARKEV